MKKFFLFFIMVSCSGQLIWAQTDSLKKAKADSIHRADSTRRADSLNKVSLLKKAEALQKQNVAQDSTGVKACPCIPHCEKSLGFWEWLLVLFPFILFLILFFIMGIPKGFTFKDALSENEQATQIIKNPEYTIANITALKDVQNLTIVLPPTIEVSDPNTQYRPSISRYIAFITGILTIIVALCMASFFLYHYISTGCPPDLSALSTILIALGIGVAPYAFNKVSTAIKGKPE